MIKTFEKWLEENKNDLESRYFEANKDIIHNKEMMIDALWSSDYAQYLENLYDCYCDYYKEIREADYEKTEVR